MTNRSPTLLKWPFILADVLLLVVSAWILTQILPYRTTGAYIVSAFAIVAWIIGAFICIWPWMAEFKAQTQQLQNDTLADALQQIERLEEVGVRVQTASANWQSAHDSAVRVTNVAKEIEERIKADSKDFMEFAERLNTDEKQNLRLEVEKLRRNEAEWLQVAARMLDHTFALTAAALRSGQPNLASQMTNFQNACRDAARRVGLVPFHPNVGDAFDERAQQLEDPNAKPEAGAVISDILATGFTFQGQLLRKALVRVSQAGAEPQPTESAQETPVFKDEMAPQEQEQMQAAKQTEDYRTAGPETESQPARPTEEQIAVEEASPEPVPQPIEETAETQVSEEQIVEVAAIETPAEEGPPAEEPTLDEQQPRRQRKPDPQTSLPF